MCTSILVHSSFLALNNDEYGEQTQTILLHLHNQSEYPWEAVLGDKLIILYEFFISSQIRLISIWRMMNERKKQKENKNKTNYFGAQIQW